MAKKLISLEDHNAGKREHFRVHDLNKPVPNGIACPECGEELFDSNPMSILTSIPPKKAVHCEKCKYSGFRLC
jgi:hypothetical protein